MKVELVQGMPTLVLGADDPAAAATARYYSTLVESMRGNAGDAAKARRFADDCDRWRATNVVTPGEQALVDAPPPMPKILVEPLADDEPAHAPRKGRIIR